MFKNKILFLFAFSFVFFTFANVATVFAAACAIPPNSCEVPSGGDCPGGRLVTGGTCSDPTKLCCAPSAPATSSGGFSYELLEKIPGTDTLSGADLPGYIRAIYKIALVVVVLSAVLMLSVGGFMYLTSAGNTSAMGTAKTIIYDSLIGLVIALTAWLVLYVINPDLVEVSLNALSPIAPASVGSVSDLGSTIPPTPPPTAAPPVTTGDPWPDDTPERSRLNTGITVNRSPGCTTVGQPACTSLAGSAAIDAINALQVACGGCSIMITGGTECWLHGGAFGCTRTHHNRGDYALDLAHGAIDTYIKNRANAKVICDLRGRMVYKDLTTGAVYWDEDNAHWHVNFNSAINCLTGL